MCFLSVAPETHSTQEQTKKMFYLVHISDNNIPSTLSFTLQNSGPSSVHLFLSPHSIQVLI